MAVKQSPGFAVNGLLANDMQLKSLLVTSSLAGEGGDVR